MKIKGSYIKEFKNIILYLLIILPMGIIQVGVGNYILTDVVGYSDFNNLLLTIINVIIFNITIFWVLGILKPISKQREDILDDI